MKVSIRGGSRSAWYARNQFLAMLLASAAWIEVGCVTEPLSPYDEGSRAELRSGGEASHGAGRQLAPWQTSTPEAQGIDSAKLADVLLAIRDQDIHVHSLLIARNDKVVANAYFYPYDGTTVHDLASVTKSVMTTLIGIAADQGKLSLDDSMVSFFPDRTIANQSALKTRITVRDLVSMTSGLDCEKEPAEPTVSEMRASPDWIQFVLDREVVREPGTYFVYCSPGMHLLSAILQQATGMTALEFARSYLFRPLGIREVIWPSDPQGYNTGWGELRIHPHDMAKLGYLWAHGGVWHGRHVISQEWVEASVRPLSDTREGSFYGYGWWVDTGEPASYSAEGRGGQYVIVVPRYNIVIAATGGGFFIDQIAPLLLATLSDSNEPLPHNRKGMEQLKNALQKITDPPAAVPVGPLPEVARVISGNMYAIEMIPGESVGLEFMDGAEAIFNYTTPDSDEVISKPIGLDGVYRLSPGEYDLPEGRRGNWADDQTFVLEDEEIANQGHIVVKMRFIQDHVTLEVTDLTDGLVSQFEGTLLGKGLRPLGRGVSR